MINIMFRRQCNSVLRHFSSVKPTSRNWFVDKLVVYHDLSKFRLSSLVVLTCGAGFICTGLPIDLLTFGSACIGTGLCAASANTFNQTIEQNRDAKMNRTKTRPFPSGRIKTPEALTFGTVVGSAGVGLLYGMTNPVVAALGLGNIFLYAVPYTLSKPVSEVNTWIGALVGAIPPVMGWAASSGGAIFTAEPMALASILFLWQFPHFFALSWLYREDYKKGGFMMVPCNDETGERTAKLISSYSNYLAVLPPLTSMAGLTSYMFAFEGTVLNIYLIYLARKFQNDKSNGNARRIFLYSLPYLPLLLAGYVFHSRTWNKNEIENENVITNEFNLSSYVNDLRNFMKEKCIHEQIIHDESKQSNAGRALCPKVATTKISDAITSNETAETVTTVTSASTTPREGI